MGADTHNLEYTQTMLPVMSEAEARQAEGAIIETGVRLRSLLLTFYERQGYRALGYTSYTAWSEAVAPRMFGLNRHKIARELTAAIIERELEPNGSNSTPIPEYHLRPMGAAFVDRGSGPGADQRPPMVDGEAIRAAWAEANDRSSGQPTNAIVAEVVREMRAMPSELVQAPEPVPPARPMDVHFASSTPEWYTPRHVIDHVIAMFGEIDLDPCSNAKGAAANVPATEHYTIADNGLSQPWHGSVYMNPPYGDEIKHWTARLVQAYTEQEIEQAIALVPARIDTEWFQPFYEYQVCFVRRRLRFVGAENDAPFPSAIVYLGLDRSGFLEHFSSMGTIMIRDRQEAPSYDHPLQPGT